MVGGLIFEAEPPCPRESCMPSFRLRGGVATRRENLTRRRGALLGVLLPLSLLSSGCSFLVVHGPPTGHEAMSTFSCTESRGAPIIDIALGAFWVWFFHADGSNDPLLPVTHGISAAYGFKKVSDCRRAQSAAARRAVAARSQLKEPDTGRIRAP